MTDHDLEILEDWFKANEDWICEYIETDDHMEGYSYLIGESCNINESVRRLLKAPYGYYEVFHEFMGWMGSKKNLIPVASKLVERFADDIATEIYQSGRFECRCVYEYSSESCGYLDSFHIGEYEDQIEISRIREDIEDKLDGEFWEVLYEFLESDRSFCLTWDANMHERKYPTMYQHVNTGMRVDYYVEDEVLSEILTETIIRECEKDGNDSSSR